MRISDWSSDVCSSDLSVEYLHVFGYTAYAYMWARMVAAAFAKQDEGDFYQSKLGTARFYFARLLPRIHSLSASVKARSEERRVGKACVRRVDLGGRRLIQ